FLNQLKEYDLSFSKDLVSCIDICEPLTGQHFPDGTIHIVLGSESFLTCVYITPSGQVVVIEMIETVRNKHEKYISPEGAADYDAFLWMISYDSQAEVYQSGFIGCGYVSLFPNTKRNPEGSE
ncbi:MAG: hypothetical protein J5794_03375, partial [Lachnospiraceae bacterium]|nr:hypothetical protein [Lachnospiraceae bacterium]